MNERTTGQHVLPRHLLTGFTAFTKKKQEYTFLFRSDRPKGIPSNVVDAAKRRLFYGEPDETGIEGALGKEENRYAPAVYRTRDTGAVTEEDLETLLELTANLSVRTHHLRAGMSDAAERVFETAQDLFTGEQAAEIVYRLLKDDPRMLRGSIRKAIRGIPAFPREPHVHLWIERAVERFLIEHLAGGNFPFAGHVEAVLAVVAETLDWEGLARKSHIQALQSGVSPQARIEMYRRFEWTVVRLPEGTVILGDFGPLGVASDTGELRPLSVLGKKVERIVLPLSHDMVVLGHSGEVPFLDLDELRRRTASLSSEFFVAAQDTERERELIPLIGTERALLTEAEFQDLRSTMTREEETPLELPRNGNLSLSVIIDGTPALTQKAVQNLGALAEVIEKVINETGLPIDTRIRMLVTDDLRRTVRSVASDYGYEADIQTEGRTVPVLGKNLYARSSPPFEGTVVIHEDLWDNDATDLVLARYQLTISQVMRALIDGRRRAEGHEGKLELGATFQEELEYVAEEVLDAHDAQQMTLAFVSTLFSATDEKGEPAPPLDRLALAYVDPLRVLFQRLGEIVRDRVQPYREGHSALADILPAVGPALRELALLLANMLGMSSDRVIEWLPKGLAGSPGFTEYLQEDWSDLIDAFREQEREEASRTVVVVIRNILGRMGLYVDDLDSGERDLLVGTPRLVPEP